MAFLGMIVSAGIAEVLVFFFFNMDYSRIESVQFQDDDYYYYVKAVPKVTLAAKSHTVQRFSGPEAEEDGIYYNGPDDFDYRISTRMPTGATDRRTAEKAETAEKAAAAETAETAETTGR
jgi:hypothetical protein